MNLLPKILADSADSVVKTMIGLVVFLIWMATSAMSALNKKKQKENRDKLRLQLEYGERPAMTAPPASRPAKRIVQKPVLKRQPPPAPVAMKRLQMQMKRLPVAKIVPVTPPPLATETARTVAAPASAAQRKPSVNAKAINAWLKPATLRQQFILTEVFQPPLALRE